MTINALNSGARVWLADLERYLRHVAIERGLSTNTVSAYRRDLTPFVEEGGVGKAAGLFGKDLAVIVRELNEVLAA